MNETISIPLYPDSLLHTYLPIASFLEFLDGRDQTVEHTAFY